MIDHDTDIDDTDIETAILSNSPKFWTMYDRAASEERTALEALPGLDDDADWESLK